MVAGNVIGNSGDLVDELPIITKFRELFHDKVVNQIMSDAPAVVSAT